MTYTRRAGRRRNALIGGITAAIAATTVATGPGFAGPAQAAASSSAAPAPSCGDQILPEAMPAQDAAPQLDATERQQVAATNDTTYTKLAATAKTDPTMWLDPCGKELFVEENHAAQERSQSAALAAAGTLSTPQAGASVPVTDVSAATGEGPIAPLSQTLNLSSRPGSTHTIYLDFVGATVTGTAWNDAVSSPSIDAPAYTMDADATTFTSDELTQMQRAWAIVAEDYAAFDVNVTTADPGEGAIDRTDASDDTFGQRVIITAGGPVYDSYNRPGGISYVGVIDYVGSPQGHSYYQPSWVFTDGTTPGDGKYFGEAAAHETGHSLGLSHDGDSSTQTATDYGYYLGVSPWAPIMGAGYYDPVSQWSKGEYPAANNHEDDIAIISQTIPFLADDYGDDAADAATVSVGQTDDGMITTAADKDAFTFTASGKVDVSAKPTGLQPDLDLGATILDSDGNTVATLNPPVVDNGPLVGAGGLGIDYQLTAPEAGATYTVILDGAGSGDPATAGNYSDYGSEGPYQFSVTSTAPLTLSNADASTGALTVTGSTGASLDVTPLTVTGGAAPYTWTATGLPTGVTMNASTGNLSGTSSVAGSFPVSVSVSDGSGQTATGGFTLDITQAAAISFSSQVFKVTAGQSLSVSLVASGGVGDYIFTSEQTPSWITLGTDGTMTGTAPADTGTYNFQVTVASGSQAAGAVMTVVVTAADDGTGGTGGSTGGTGGSGGGTGDTGGSGGGSGSTGGGVAPTPAPVTVASQSFAGTVGKALRGTLNAAGGSGAYNWTLDSSDIPLSVSGDGSLTGTPATAGTFTFKVTAADVADLSNKASATMTITVAPAALAPVSITSRAFKAAGSQAFRFSLAATGGDGTYKWSASGLPAHVSLSSSGVVTGTLTGPKQYAFTAHVTSGTGSSAVTATRTISLTVSAPPAVAVTSSSVAVTSGVRFSRKLTASGGNGTYTWSAKGLPAGVSLSRAGVLAGATKRAGAWKVTVIASSAGESGRRTVTIRALWKPVTVSTGAATTKAGESFRIQLHAAGGNGSFEWVHGSSLPKGVSLSGAGVLSGKVAKAGTYRIEVKATSGAGAYARTATKTVVLRVNRR